MSRIVRTACTRHCGDGCALVVEVGEGGKLVVRGNPDHPFTQGFICAKTARFAERLTSLRRIVTPLIRDGEGFREASWEAALSLIAAQVQRLRRTPERMLHVHYHASFGLLHQASKLLFGTLGASGFSGSPCLAAGAEAVRRDFGAVRQGPLSEAMRAERIVNWGRNAGAQSVHLAAMIAKARKRGARVLSIHPGDPGYAGISDVEIVIRPGTDRFLAAAAMKILLERGQVHVSPGESGWAGGGACGVLDSASLARCADARAFLDLLGGLDLEVLLDACGVSRQQAGMLADWYSPGQGGPTATLIGRGVQRYAHGGENVRFIDALAMLTGNIGRAGGGVYYMRQDLKQAAWNWTQAEPGSGRKFPLTDLAAQVGRADPPVEFVWVEGMNLVTQCPDSLATAAMLKERFTVVVEPFMTDTARAATVILPPALMLECEDIAKADSHPYLNHSAKVLEPRGQARSNFDIASALGAVLDPPVNFPAAEEVLDTALCGGNLRSSLSELREKGFLGVDMPETPWADGVFAHPDGLYRLPEELHPERPDDPRYPLRLLSPVRRDHLLSQVPEEEQESPPRVFVSPDCAALATLAPGGVALLETAHGSMEVRVDILESLHPDAVLYPRGDWLSRGGCVNRIIRGVEADMAGQVAYYQARARLVTAPAV
ncbi:molybdopterin-dependent oxidoreductase [Fundidesulfovibrio terrae]|uniref:molybdopterin-dependent oxidoreductase n=1 Tax=Fundidesulfovibrio terrae TaxID=2922866 RepID=UPI001FAF9B14|nr:molybdopterin-dependent oxidoreductase [Fundidesulfovibrio terrae]